MNQYIAFTTKLGAKN